MEPINISSLLKQLRKTAKLSVKEAVAKLLRYGISISEKTLYGYESGLSMPNADAFVALCKIYDCDNPLDLTGEDRIEADEYQLIKKYRVLDVHGKKMVDIVLEEESSRISISKEAEKTLSVITPPPQTTELIEFLSAVSAGVGADLSSTSDYRYVNVVENIYTKKADFILTVSGESMAPRYHDGDKILVQETDDVDIGEIGIWEIDHLGYVKKRGDSYLISLNPSYPDIHVMEESVQSCDGKVIGILDPDWIVSTKEIDE